MDKITPLLAFRRFATGKIREQTAVVAGNHQVFSLTTVNASYVWLGLKSQDKQTWTGFYKMQGPSDLS